MTGMKVVELENSKMQELRRQQQRKVEWEYQMTEAEVHPEPWQQLKATSAVNSAVKLERGNDFSRLVRRECQNQKLHEMRASRGGIAATAQTPRCRESQSTEKSVIMLLVVTQVTRHGLPSKMCKRFHYTTRYTKCSHVVKSSRAETCENDCPPIEDVNLVQSTNREVCCSCQG